MKNSYRIVPVSMCLASLVAISGCSKTDTTATNVQTASNTAPAKNATPAAPEQPVAAPDVDRNDAAISLADTAPHAAPHADPPKPISTVQIVKADPEEVDLGEIPTNDSRTGKVKLVNTGSEPMTVLSARPSCGCTAMKFNPNTVIPAQESIEVDVQMQGGAMEGPLSGKTVTFVVEGQPEVVVRLKAHAISYVKHHPERIDPKENPEGKFTLKSIDDQAFKIVSANPPVVEIDPTAEPKVEHELSINWDKYREAGISRQLVVYLDHPKCQNVHVRCFFSPEEYQRNNEEIMRKRQEELAATGHKGEVPTPVMPPVVQEDPDTILLNMIKAGQNDEVLAKIGTDVNRRDNADVPLIANVAKHGNAALLKAMLDTGKADLTSTDKIGRTPLMYAAESKNVENLRVLLDAGANPSTRDNLGNNALGWAAWLGNAECVQELIDAGSEVEVVSLVMGWTPLMLAAGFGDPNSIEPLLDAHAEIEAADMIDGATPLIHAARTGSVEAIKILLKRGANIENTDRNGCTALLACAKTSGGDAVKLQALIDAGADVHAKDNRGLNALQLALKRTDMRSGDVVNILQKLLGDSTPAGDTGHADHDHAGHNH